MDKLQTTFALYLHAVSGYLATEEHIWYKIVRNMFGIIRVLLLWYIFYVKRVELASCDGECLPIACDKNNVINGNESPEFNLRLQSTECDHILEVCCQPSKITPLTLLAPMRTVGSKECGIRNVDGVGFHITGNTDGESQYAELPWTLMVLTKLIVLDESKHIHVGSASLISPGVALTAAHIISKAYNGEIFVRAGEWDLNGDNELLPVEHRKVSRTIIHEKYNSQHHNNIALLIFDKPIESDQHIRLICLPSVSAEYDHQACLTGGWGESKFEDKQMVNIMKKIQVPLIDNDQCEIAFRTTRLGQNFNLDKSYICAGGEENVDVCTGDGGAPLICPDSNGIYYQIGIVAWGIGCGQRGIPGAYTNVGMFKEWIDEKVKML
ncbi:phenoloxidase-activating factor 2-like [Topomyia yanbarensis]|uniref:phenoloxidase-activating factor 2-like n=1 Tax=Topomyia yanbarensis TaxID=2498891 RepID=UPI00273B9B20|nr:phenoloxidase-activating factor 2-like [Topomyia yanbarensis]